MTLHKIAKNIDLLGQEWQNYCHWRNCSFESFESIDSTLNKSEFEPITDEDWQNVLTDGNCLTDIITTYDYACVAAKRNGCSVILNFDFIEHEDPKMNIVGYDILDGFYQYSLLTNFGNDITVVNSALAKNGLIHDRNQVLEIKSWFDNNMSNDSHVINSHVFAVYKKSAQQER